MSSKIRDQISPRQLIRLCLPYKMTFGSSGLLSIDPQHRTATKLANVCKMDSRWLDVAPCEEIKAEIEWRGIRFAHKLTRDAGCLLNSKLHGWKMVLFDERAYLQCEQLLSYKYQVLEPTWPTITLPLQQNTTDHLMHFHRLVLLMHFALMSLIYAQSFSFHCLAELALCYV